MATLDELLAVMNAGRQAQQESLLRDNFGLQVANPVLAAKVDTTGSSRTDSFLAPFVQALVGNAFGQYGAKTYNRDIAESDNLINQALTSENRREALRGLIDNPIAGDRARELADYFQAHELAKALAGPTKREVSEAFLQQASGQLGVPVSTKEELDLALKLPGVKGLFEQQKLELKNRYGGSKQKKDKEKEESFLPDVVKQFPDKQRNQAIKELDYRDTAARAIEKIDELVDASADIGLGAMIPYSETRAALRGINANIASQVAAAVKGNPSDSETRRQIEPFLIDALDSAEAREEKRRQLHHFIGLNKRSTPLLDRAPVTAPTGAALEKEGGSVNYGARLKELEKAQDASGLKALVGELRAKGLSDDDIRGLIDG